MSAQHADERNARGFERFLLLSDGIAAIAITLLILPLVDAVIDSTGHATTTADILRDIRWEIFSFLLSFAVILSLWLAHQDVFNGVHTVTKPVVATGMVWLLAIAFLPFTTALIADHADEQATLVLYVANVATAVYAMSLATWWLHRNPALLHAHETISTASLASAGRTSILITAALLIALIVPGIGFFVMLVLGLNQPLRQLMDRRASR